MTESVLQRPAFNSLHWESRGLHLCSQKLDSQASKDTGLGAESRGGHTPVFGSQALLLCLQGLLGKKDVSAVGLAAAT